MSFKFFNISGTELVIENVTAGIPVASLLAVLVNFCYYCIAIYCHIYIVVILPKHLGPPNVLEGLRIHGKCDNYTAILRWDILPKYNNSATFVIIEWQTTYDPEDWYRVPVKVNANVGQAKVNNLTAWSKVQFRAITQNIYGDSPVSERTYLESCLTSSTRKYMMSIGLCHCIYCINIYILKLKCLKLVLSKKNQIYAYCICTISERY